MHAKPKRVFKFLLIVVSTFSPLLDGFCYDITGINQRDTAQVIQLNQSAASILNAYPDSTNKLLLDALTISHEIGFGRGKAISCDHLGLVPFLKESYDSARYYWDMSLIEWEQARNNEQIAKTLEKLAKTLKLQSNFAQAISFYQRAIRLRFVIEDTLLIANNLQNIGSIYTEIGDPKKALQYQHKARNLFEKTADEVAIVNSYAILGTTYLSENPDSVEYFINKALEFYLNTGDTLGSAKMFLAKANLYYAGSTLNKALKSIDKGLNLAEGLNSKRLIVDFNLLQAKILLAQGKANLALQSINACHGYFDENSSVAKVTSLKLLAQIYYDQKQFDKSVFYYGLYTTKNDSIQNMGHERKVAGLTAKYNYDVREAKLEKEQTLKQNTLERLIEQKQLAQSRSTIIFLFIVIVLSIIVWFLILTRKKNQSLRKQQHEIEQLFFKQRRIIEERTSELLASKRAISHYTFLNSHDLRAPLSKILSILYLFDRVSIQKEFLFKALKDSAKELEQAVKKIIQELPEEKRSGCNEL